MDRRGLNRDGPVTQPGSPGPRKHLRYSAPLQSRWHELLRSTKSQPNLREPAVSYAQRA